MFMARRCSATGLPKFGLTPTLRSGATGNWPARNDHARKCHIQPLHYGPVPYRSLLGTDSIHEVGHGPVMKRLNVPYRSLLGTDSIHEVALRSGLQTAPHPIM